MSLIKLDSSKSNDFVFVIDGGFGGGLAGGLLFSIPISSKSFFFLKVPFFFSSGFISCLIDKIQSSFSCSEVVIKLNSCCVILSINLKLFFTF